MIHLTLKDKNRLNAIRVFIDHPNCSMMFLETFVENAIQNSKIISVEQFIKDFSNEVRREGREKSQSLLGLR